MRAKFSPWNRRELSGLVKNVSNLKIQPDRKDERAMVRVSGEERIVGLFCVCRGS